VRQKCTLRLRELNKIEAMIQTVAMEQQLYSKAALIGHEKLTEAQNGADLLGAESILQDAKQPSLPPGCAHAIVWLPSEQSAKTPGHVISVNGGLSEAFLR
jgi:hypothetical protein